jgi:hypothetical protein
MDHSNLLDRTIPKGDSMTLLKTSSLPAPINTNPTLITPCITFQQNEPNLKQNSLFLVAMVLNPFGLEQTAAYNKPLND